MRPNTWTNAQGRLSSAVMIGLIAIAFATPASGQMRVGLRGGLSVSGMSTDEEGLGFGKGLIGGGWIRTPLRGVIGLQVEGYYVQKGFRETDAQNATVAWLQLDYFEFPLLLTFLVNRGEPQMGYVAVGGAFSLERGCTFGARGEGVSAEVDCDQFNRNSGGLGFYPENFDAGLVMGGGLEIDVGSLIVTFDARADAGLREAVRFSPSGFDSETFGGRNFSLQIMMGIAFPLH